MTARHDEERPVSALTIAGSDSGGGAGIQADLKTFAAHRVHGLSAIAALTAQHTRGVTAVESPPLPFLRAQITACFDDFDIGAVKTGMLGNADTVQAVVKAFDQHCPQHIVVDPVMVATSGAQLLANSAIEVVRALNGATDGRKAAPGSIRGDLSISNRENLVHGSDSAESAAREIAIWFPELG